MIPIEHRLNNYTIKNKQGEAIITGDAKSMGALLHSAIAKGNEYDHGVIKDEVITKTTTGPNLHGLKARSFLFENVQFLDVLGDSMVLSGSVFKGCTFSGVVFCSSSFFGCVFIDCKFKSCIFNYSNFEASRFEECLFSTCEFKATSLGGATLQKCDIYLCKMLRVNLSATFLTDTSLKACDFTHGDLTLLTISGGAIIDGTFLQTDLRGTRFLKSTELSGMDLKEAILDGVDFSPCVGTPLLEMEINDASLAGTTFVTASPDTPEVKDYVLEVKSLLYFKYMKQRRRARNESVSILELMNDEVIIGFRGKVYTVEGLRELAETEKKLRNKEPRHAVELLQDVLNKRVEGFIQKLNQLIITHAKEKDVPIAFYVESIMEHFDIGFEWE